MSSFSFDCGICLETVEEKRTRVRTIGDDFVCSKCAPDIKPLFEDALKSEINFPPKWGPYEIDFGVFSDLFPDNFRLAWYDKLREYQTPIPERVYCQHRVPASAGESEAAGDLCSAFVGVSKPLTKARCDTCKSWMCMECRGTAYQPLNEHVCNEFDADSETDALDEATRGKEWQECPNTACKINCYRRDGCNAMICVCGCAFCYICGEEAGHNSGHWNEGKRCPRWGDRDGKNPMFDEPQRMHADMIDFEPAPGHVVVNLQLGDNTFRVEVNERLFNDNNDGIELAQAFGVEMHMLVDDDEPIPQVILDMEDLLIDLRENVGWLEASMSFDQAFGFGNFRALMLDPIAIAVETTNFFIRDERLQARLRRIHAAALQLTGQDSILAQIPVMELFERYLNEHKPVYEASLRRFQFMQDGARAPWMRLRDEDWEMRRRASQ